MISPHSTPWVQHYNHNLCIWRLSAQWSWRVAFTYHLFVLCNEFKLGNKSWFPSALLFVSAVEQRQRANTSATTTWSRLKTNTNRFVHFKPDYHVKNMNLCNTVECWGLFTFQVEPNRQRYFISCVAGQSFPMFAKVCDLFTALFSHCRWLHN